MKTSELEFEIAKLQLNRDDVLVIKTEHVLTLQHANDLREHLRRTLQRHQRVLLLDNGIDIAVLTKDEIEKRART